MLRSVACRKEISYCRRVVPTDLIWGNRSLEVHYTLLGELAKLHRRKWTNLTSIESNKPVLSRHA